jgi:hypothetical protein
MKRSSITLLLLAALAALAAPLAAAVPPAAQLFPQDTVVLLSVPDWQKAAAAMKSSAGGRLWADPAMEAFRRKFEERFREKVVEDLERQLGIKLADYAAIAQGQISLAAFRAETPTPDRHYDWVMVMDSRDKADQLQKLLGETRGKLGAANKTTRSTKVRERDFTTVVIEAAELEKLMQLTSPATPKKPQRETPPKAATKLEITFGQVDSALVLGSSAKSLEKVVTRLTGGLVPPIGEQATYASHEAMFRNSQATAWLDFQAILEPISQAVTEAFGGLAALGADPRKAPGALGFEGLQSIGFSATQNADGSLFQFVLRVPESKRAGVFKLLHHEPKEASVPPFVPGDAVKFSRWRISGPKMLQTIEEILGRIAPQLVGVLQFSLETAGEAQGQKLNLRKTLLETLGDDFVSWEKAPKGSTDADIENAPSISLIGSPNGEGLIAGVQALMQLAPDGAQGLKSREFLGRKIHTLTVPGTEGPEHTMNFAASGGYVALSDQASILEEYLRSADNPGRPLREFPGMAEAAQKIGGFSVGMFTFENQVETTRVRWEAARQSGNIDHSVPTVVAALGMVDALKSWADFSLLPPFEKVSRHFGFCVETFGDDAQGFNLKILTPSK